MEQLMGAANPLRSNVCSPSEIGSVFGLRFDPQENKMTLQLTAAPAAPAAVSPPPAADPAADPAAGQSAMDVSPEAFQVATSPLHCR